MSDAFFTRRSLLTASSMAALGLITGCQTAPTPPPTAAAATPPAPSGNNRYNSVYGAMLDEGFQIPAVPWDKIESRFLRQEVANNTGVGAGKVVVETSQHHLYFTMPGGRAMRYGVGLGREGFEWSGRCEVRLKAKWPKWHPPEEMIDREPELEKYRTTHNRRTDTWEGVM